MDDINIVNEKVYADKIKRCICNHKEGNKYVIKCKGIIRSNYEYLYEKDGEYIDLNYDGNKRPNRLWLLDESKQIIDNAINVFDNKVEKLKTEYGEHCNNNDIFHVCYKHIVLTQYDVLIIYDDGNTKAVYYFENELINNVFEYLKFIKYVDFKSMICGEIENNPIYIEAQRNNDKYLMEQIKLYYRIASTDECAHLSKNLNVTILPSLSEDYDKDYYVIIDNELRKILSNSGYLILHRPYFTYYPNYTNKIWRLNPHEKTGTDAAPKDSIVISSIEYLQLFEN